MWERGATHDGQRSNTLLLAATSAAILALVPVAAHQVGLLSHLPDPSGALFASDEIADSKAAHPLGMPDAVAGLASYATTMTLALMTPSHPKARRLSRRHAGRRWCSCRIQCSSPGCFVRQDLFLVHRHGCLHRSDAHRRPAANLGRGHEPSASNLTTSALGRRRRLRLKRRLPPAAFYEDPRL